jgi:hypothetical protein
MNEDFLSFIWAFRFLNSELHTTGGDPLVILHPGEHNHDSGPDFTNARIRIGDTLWAGNVEIHVNSSDWFRHNHHLDKVYENVILHVVLHDDADRGSGPFSSIPVMVVEGHFPEMIFRRYLYLLENPSWIPCHQQIRDIELFHFNQWSATLVIERLIDRCRQWKMLLEFNRFDWEETFYQGIARTFGLSINTLPFELLAKSLPLKVIYKHQINAFQLEALSFGQAGMLNHVLTDDYTILLKKEYEFLANKYGLKPIEPTLWKFLRLRPSAFPTIRIAQWTVFLKQISVFFNLVLKCGEIAEIEKLLMVTASEYWDNHYRFSKLSPGKSKILGDTTIKLLILNFVVPFLFFYGEEKSIQSFKEHGLKLLEELPGESNAIVSQWKSLGMPVENALKTQALLQLKSNYCDRKKCLSCRIGVRLLGRK